MIIPLHTIKHFLRLGVLLFVPMLLHAQNIKVSGVVLDDETATPLPGVTINLKSTNTGVITEADGTFQMDVPTDAILIFSYIGMKSQE
ncbi:MAG: carboxypeptidase-like regulatory domain-containing protein, partial [Saprospiraceae bacterium]|nr:carboxypeptidase-like regulatory domain-containing protein [Saprospiraceae bacterium]